MMLSFRFEESSVLQEGKRKEVEVHINTDQENNAHHEAGHCLVSFVLGCRPHLITIEGQPRVEHQSIDSVTNKALILWAGPTAQTKAGGQACFRNSRDQDDMIQLIPQLGAAAECIPKAARSCVEKHWAAIQELAAVVLLRGTLQGPELDRELSRFMLKDS
jgi:hypothetical protein